MDSNVAGAIYVAVLAFAIFEVVSTSITLRRNGARVSPFMVALSLITMPIFLLTIAPFVVISLAINGASSVVLRFIDVAVLTLLVTFIVSFIINIPRFAKIAWAYVKLE